MDAGRRLDLYLAARLPELSRTRIQELIGEGHVRVDSGSRQRPSHRGRRNDRGRSSAAAAAGRRARRHAARTAVRGRRFRGREQARGDGGACGAGATRGTLVNALLPSHLGALSRRAARCGPASCTGWTAARPAPWWWRATTPRTSARRTIPRAHRAQDVSRAAARKNAARCRHHHAADCARSAPAHAHDRAPAHRARSAHRLARDAAPGNCTLVEAEPHTGRTHQIRAHFAATGIRWWATRSTARRSARAPAACCFRRSGATSCTRPASVSRTLAAAARGVRAPLDRDLREYLDQLAGAVELAAPQG